MKFGILLFLLLVALVFALSSCSFLVAEAPLEEKIAEDVIRDVATDIEQAVGPTGVAGVTGATGTNGISQNQK